MGKYVNEYIKKCIQDAINNGEFEVSEYIVKNGSAIRIDKVVVAYSDNNGVYFTLDDNVDHTYMILWNMDVGGILRGDFRKKQFDKYLELKTKNSTSLIRRIDDDELEQFKQDRLDHIIMGNYTYCIIKTVGLNESYVYKSTYNDVIRDNDVYESEIKEDEDIDSGIDNESYEDECDDKNINTVILF